jgi:maltose O-acetyltransferase
MLNETPLPRRGKLTGLFRLFGRCLKSDVKQFRTRLFVGCANWVPNFDLLSTFVRPLLLRLAGVRIGLPAAIHSPLFVGYAGSISIGRYAFINQGLYIEGLNSVTIGEGALIGPFCCIANVNHRPEGSEELPMTIGKGAWIDCGSILLPGASIGDGAVIAAGSVVRGTCLRMKSVPVSQRDGLARSTTSPRL